VCVLPEIEEEIDPLEHTEPMIEWPIEITKTKNGYFDATLAGLDITVRACKSVRHAQTDLQAELIFELAKQYERYGDIPTPPVRTEAHLYVVKIPESDVVSSIVLSVEDGDEGAKAFISEVTRLTNEHYKATRFY
jgi:hypothetical protein